MYKVKFGLLPVSCSKLFTFNADNRYDFRQANDFLMVKFHTEVWKRCISVSGPNLWNCLCVEIKTITSISLFKEVLMRSYLYNYLPYVGFLGFFVVFLRLILQLSE